MNINLRLTVIGFDLSGSSANLHDLIRGYTLVIYYSFYFSLSSMSF